MELLRNIDSGEYEIKPDGTFVGYPGVYEDFTNDIQAWVFYGYPLSDGKTILQQTIRIVSALSGSDIDDKFSSLPDDDTKKIAGRELVFYLQKETLTDSIPPVMTEEEYAESVIYRQNLSREARNKRWEEMISQLLQPSVIFGDMSKLALALEKLKEYRDDYLDYDNRIIDHFILGEDHPFALNDPPYTRDVAFATSSNIALLTLSFWDLPVPDNDYRDLVCGIITDTIINGNQYIT